MPHRCRPTRPPPAQVYQTDEGTLNNVAAAVRRGRMLRYVVYTPISCSMLLPTGTPSPTLVGVPTASTPVQP